MRLMSKLLVASVLLCALVPKSVAAEETWLAVTVRSYHFNRDKDYNEENYGLGIERQGRHAWGWAAGFYENSYYRTTVYAGPTYTFADWGTIKLRACACLATGYKHPIGFYPLPTIGIEGKQVGANIAVTPSMMGLQLKWKW